MIEPLSINDPVLGFRLDPGEPGMLRRARASDATIRVTAQERRNLGRLKTEAFREGRIPIQAGAVFTRSLPGTGVGTVVSGQSTVVSVPDSTPPVSGVRIPGEELVRSLLEDVLSSSPPDDGQGPSLTEPDAPASSLAFGRATTGPQGEPALAAAFAQELTSEPSDAPSSKTGAANQAARAGASRFEQDQRAFLNSRLEQESPIAAEPQETARRATLDLTA